MGDLTVINFGFVLNIRGFVISVGMRFPISTDIRILSVFGFNPNYPSVLHDKLPALENSSKDIIRQTTNAIHSARRNYIAAESSERIRRALRHNVRTYSDTVYINGDRV